MHRARQAVIITRVIIIIRVIITVALAVQEVHRQHRLQAEAAYLQTDL